MRKFVELRVGFDVRLRILAAMESARAARESIWESVSMDFRLAGLICVEKSLHWGKYIACFAYLASHIYV